ncbi:hypothetical protein [Polaromonas sp.]|uniref:hypothetical protein n=1 Tax=Polaromonas sp. TaxID=1869339 RepID=UPI003C9E427B
MIYPNNHDITLPFSTRGAEKESMTQDRSNNSDGINDEEPYGQPPKKTVKRPNRTAAPKASRKKLLSKRKPVAPTDDECERPVAAVSRQNQIDKLELVLPIRAMSAFELEEAGQRIGAIDQVRKISAKGDSYRMKFVLTCPSEAKVVFCLIAADDRMHYGVKIVLNPSRMEGKEDVQAFHQCLKQLFLPNWRGQLAMMLLQRADHAYDLPVPRHNLIIQLKGSPSEQKFFVRSDREGIIQTWYAGSIESRIHWLMYCQEASDEYKRAHGELPRPKARDDAELVFGKSKVAGMTRFEARRVFDKALTLREADAEKNPLGNFEVYLIDTQKLAAAPADFTLFLDSVRLRGVAGAGKQYLDQHPGREGKKKLAVFNAYLATCMAPWWDKSGLSSSIELALKDKQIWNVLKHLAR